MKGLGPIVHDQVTSKDTFAYKVKYFKPFIGLFDSILRSGDVLAVISNSFSFSIFFYCN